MNEAAPAKIAHIVGRAGELAAIRAALGRLEAGSGTALFLTGEAGIGKSTLARSAANAAADRGLPVFWGFAWESGGAPAYWPWTQLLRSLEQRFPGVARQREGLARILPDGGAASPLRLQPDQARFLLLEDVRALLESAAGQTPFVLILEDLHAADNESLELLQHVTRHVAGLPILLIGTFRSAEARGSAAGEPLWRSTRDATVLDLRRLNADEVRELLSRSSRQTPSDELVGLLLDTTAGNPLFLAELAGTFGDREPPTFLPAALPDSVQQVIRQQLDRLPDETLDVLTAASVLGRDFTLERLSQLTNRPRETLDALLAPAEGAEILRRRGPSREFGHGLYREVLYQALTSELREELHGRRAARLREAVREGDRDRWSELAHHLSEAGEDLRREAIAAWREAGLRASERLAFGEAASSYGRALGMFGEGPQYPPAERGALMLDLAGALLTRGDVRTGRQLCREVFELAQSVDDASLLAEAALTYGSVIEVARVDRHLVAMLDEALRRLPATDAAGRARVQARHAAARQPARDPGEPMQMARLAILEARETEDDRVLYDVLTSAISALMDFAPARERLPLNREMEALARQFRDIPGEFRSNLRIMIDAAELADRNLFDDVIDRLERIARRIGLPHYAWRMASARAMQATVVGEFAAAWRLLDDAERLAGEACDRGAAITIPLQRLGILQDWDAPDDRGFDDVVDQVRRGLVDMPDARAYAWPLFSSVMRRHGVDIEGASVADPALIERFFAGGDRFCLTRLGEYAIAVGDAALVERVFDALAPFEDQCATMGLMGTYWGGPVAHTLGLLAEALGRTGEARRCFAIALDIAERMGARPRTCRIYESMAEFGARTGEAEVAAGCARRAAELANRLRLRGPAGRPRDVPPAAMGARRDAPVFTMNREGDVWEVGYDGSTALVKATKGVSMLAVLVARPDADIHVLDLAGTGPEAATDTGDAGPMLDERARGEYRRHLADLEEELEDARDMGDAGRAEEIQGEIDFITAELARAFGLGGRRRRAGKATERARVNVRRRLTDAIKRIDAYLPGAGRYLESTIRTGTYCRYSPL